MEKNYNYSRSLITFFSAACICIILTGSCRKENDTPEPDYSKVYLLKSENEEGYNWLIHLTVNISNDYVYDTAGRIIRSIYKDPGGADTTFYSYNDSTSIIVLIKSRYSQQDTTIMTLNDEGLAIIENKITRNVIVKNEYDALGYRVISRSYTYGVDTSDITGQVLTKTYTYANGNLVSETSETGHKQDYSYYNDKINTLGYISKGMAFYGKSSKNLRLEENAQDEFDADNRLKKRLVDEWTTEYEYY